MRTLQLFGEPPRLALPERVSTRGRGVFAHQVSAQEQEIVTAAERAVAAAGEQPAAEDLSAAEPGRIRTGDLRNCFRTRYFRTRYFRHNCRRSNSWTLLPRRDSIPLNSPLHSKGPGLRQSGLSQ